MTLKQCILSYIKAQHCEVKRKDLNAMVKEIEAEIDEAKRTGDISRVELRWTKLYETFFVGHHPLEALDPFLDHLSGLFPEIKAKFELVDKIAAMFLQLPFGVPAVFPKQRVGVNQAGSKKATITKLVRPR